MKIMRYSFQTSSYFSLELFWISCLFCETNHSLLFLIFLILVIFVLDLLTPVHSMCTRVTLFILFYFFISIKLILITKKKRKNSAFSRSSCARKPVYASQLCVCTLIQKHNSRNVSHIQPYSHILIYQFNS